MNLPIEIIANILKFNENRYLICKELLKYYIITIRYDDIDHFSIFIEKANVQFKSYHFKSLKLNLINKNQIAGTCECLLWSKINNVNIEKKKIIYDDMYNDIIPNLPKFIEKIQFGFAFNKTIDNLPDNINTIIFGEAFNQEINKFPEEIRKIYFGCSYNKKLFLPDNINTLHLGNNFSKKIENLPNNLKSFGVNFFTLNLIKKQKFLQTLKITSYFEKISEVCIPESVNTLILMCRYIGSIPNNVSSINYLLNTNEIPLSNTYVKHITNYCSDTFPNKLRSVSFNHYFNKSINLFPQTLKKIVFGFNFNMDLIELPESLEHLELGHKFNTNIILPKNIRYVKFGFDYNKSVDIPCSVETLIFGYCFNKIFIIPDNLVELRLGINYRKKINCNIPISLKHLEIEYNSLCYFENSLNNLLTLNLKNGENKEIYTKLKKKYTVTEYCIHTTLFVKE